MNHLYHPASPHTVSPSAADMPRVVLTDAIVKHLIDHEHAQARTLLTELARHQPAHARLLMQLLPA